MSEKTLVERLEAAAWTDEAQTEMERAVSAGVPLAIADEIRKIAKLCGEAATALTQAQARCAEVEKDAARYRWLREYCKTPYDQRSMTLLGDTLDEAVDAALADAIKEPL